ncbi:MAG: DNA polymerase III subunit beta [Nitrospinota bacterium]
MEIAVARDVFHRALQGMQGVVESKSSAMPILQNFLLDAREGEILLQGTDLDIGLKARYPARVEGEGAVTLPARKLFDIVRELSGEEVRLVEEKGQWVKMESGRARFRFPGLPPEDFPPLPEPGGEGGVELERGLLLEMIRKTIFAVSADETRYTYNGVFLQGEGDLLRMVATDGHRLALIERPCPGLPEELGAIIHRKALGELTKLLSAPGEGGVQLFLQENHAIFALESITLSARLIEGQFPNYQQVIPRANEKRASLDRAPLVGALRRVSLLASESRMVKFTFAPGTLSLSTEASEVGEAREELEAEYEGEEVAIGFNARYCLDMLNAVEEERVRFDLKDPLSPALLLPVGAEGYTYVLMPMRV